MNAQAVGALAATCQALGATFVHFSTDYVFDGRRPAPYRESDAPNPLNVYGESKLEGERQALARCERAVIFRVSGLFGVARSSGKGGTNFVETMLRLARERKPVRVVADQALGQGELRGHADQLVEVAERHVAVLERQDVVARLHRGEEVADRLDRHEQRVHRQQHDREAELP